MLRNTKDDFMKCLFLQKLNKRVIENLITTDITVTSKILINKPKRKHIVIFLWGISFSTTGISIYEYVVVNSCIFHEMNASGNHLLMQKHLFRHRCIAVCNPQSRTKSSTICLDNC